MLLFGLLHCHILPLCRKTILSKTAFSGAGIAIVRETILGKEFPSISSSSLLCREEQFINRRQKMLLLLMGGGGR